MSTAFQDLLYADGSGGGSPVVEHELCSLALASDPSRSDEPNPSTSDEPTEIIDLIGDAQKQVGTLQPSEASLAGEYSLFDDIDGGSAPPVMDKPSSKMEPKKALAANHIHVGELKEVNRALNNHMSEVLTLLRQTGANTSNITKIPKSLINPLREKTMTALRNADYCFTLSRALLVPEKDAILLYAEEIKKKKKEGKKRQRFEATKNGGTDSGGQLERKTKVAIASASRNKSTFPHAVVAAPFTSKRPRSGFKLCSSKGCTNNVVKGGVCRRHGAKAKLCSSDGCTNQAYKGGVCTRHGAKKKRCSIEGCTKQAVLGGVCVRHGAMRKLCSREGCTKQACRGGVCWKHGAQDLKKKT